MRERQIGICVFRHQGRILAAPGFDDVKKERFFRPLGGSLEPGEQPVDALRREIREELGATILNPVQIGVFDATFADSQLYAQPALPIHEPGWSGPAQWLRLSDPLPGPLYPEGLFALVEYAV